MCILYALKLWKKMGGRLLFTFQPNFHVLVLSASGRIFHGTNKSESGNWRIEEIDSKAFTRWLIGRKG